MMDRGKARLELERLISEAPRIAPSIARFDEARNYGTVTDENLDIPSFIRWELESGAAFQTLAASGAPVFTKLHGDYLHQKEEAKGFHSRSILAHQIMLLLTSALQLLDSAWSEPPQLPATTAAAEAVVSGGEAPVEQSPSRTRTDLSLPDKITIAWAVRHVPLSAWFYLVGILGSTFIAGATVSQLPAVRSLLPVFHEGNPSQSSVTPSSLDERIRVLTEAHTQRVAKITEGIVAEERNAGLAINSVYHIDAAKRLREMLREENESYQKSIAQLRTLSSGGK